jgi:hypothetical protein
MLRDARCRYAAARAALRANTGAGTHLVASSITRK